MIKLFQNFFKINTKAKRLSFFDLPSADQKKIIKKANRESNRLQKELDMTYINKCVKAMDC
ncbi:MAG: hypothetical protein ACD_22C00082G0008 [uncultured bacterium]|nr:MAG: hypothetical protein ACD_22C00082G0008 [uncultured bacterium]